MYERPQSGIHCLRVMDLKKQTWKPYLLWVLFTEAVGGLSALLTGEAVERYAQEIVKPPLSPPGYVFPIAWALLYALMGIAAARVSLKPPSAARKTALWLFLLQLAVNFCWSPLFFSLRAFGFAFIWLVILWALVVRMTLSFRELDRTAALLQIPYLLWLLFAGYLNYGVWKLN